MKSGAVFVNTARGAIVDQAALLDALDSGRLFAAGIDVTDPEPLPADHPLLHQANLVVTPHIASATAEGKLRSLESAFEQAIAVVHGERPAHLVNPEAWGRMDPATTTSGGDR
jgi:phosphoglycerate dehydrogenase-like enzyme